MSFQTLTYIYDRVLDIDNTHMIQCKQIYDIFIKFGEFETLYFDSNRVGYVCLYTGYSKDKSKIVFKNNDVVKNHLRQLKLERICK